MIRSVILGLALCPLGVSAIDLPLQRAPGGQPVIEAVDGQGRAVPCLFDTGATQSVLAPHLIHPDRDRALGEIAASGASATGHFASWGIRGWQLGGRPLPEFAALRVDLGSSTPCVLGPAALGTRRIELDGVAGRFRAGGQLPELPLHLPYTLVQGFMRLRLPFAAETEATLILDTGAGTTVLNRRAGELLGLDPLRPARWVERRGIDGLRRRHRVHAVTDLRLLPGGAALIRVEIAELPVLTPLGVSATAPGGLLGADALDGRRLVIDLDRRRLELDEK